jgi:hypothetical protein
MFGIYTARGHKQLSQVSRAVARMLHAHQCVCVGRLHARTSVAPPLPAAPDNPWCLRAASTRQVYDKLEFNAVFDLPFFFCRGADRMRILSNLLACPFDMTVARPTLVSLQILNNKVRVCEVGCEGAHAQQTVVWCVPACAHWRTTPPASACAVACRTDTSAPCASLSLSGARARVCLFADGLHRRGGGAGLLPAGTVRAVPAQSELLHAHGSASAVRATSDARLTPLVVGTLPPPSSPRWPATDPQGAAWRSGGAAGEGHTARHVDVRHRR